MLEFVQYLVNTKQSVFDLFRSMDLDDSEKSTVGSSWPPESSSISALSSIEGAALVESMDLDGDGELNLPELDIAIAQINVTMTSCPRTRKSEPHLGGAGAHWIGWQTQCGEVHFFSAATMAQVDMQAIRSAPSTQM